jgi:hypothetical protein
MKWYNKVGYKIKKVSKGYVISCPEWWIGPFETFGEAEAYIDYLW